MNLAPAQEKRIEELLDPYLKEQQEMKTKNKELQKRLMELIADKEKPDRANMNRILDEIASLKGLRERSTMEHLIEVKRLLNEE